MSLPSVYPLNDTAVLVQRFCYKLCELRKACTTWRFKWRTPWNVAKAREAFLESHPNIAYPAIDEREE